LVKQKKIAVTGASGLIGSALCAQLKSDGHQVIKVVRRAARVADEVSWNPLKGEIDLAGLEGADAVFHLAGAGVGDKLMTSYPLFAVNGSWWQTKHLVFEQLN